MYNTPAAVLKLIDDVGIENALGAIDIDDIDDSALKIILRTIEFSIQRLREELEDLN